jgi:hypothetical protein
MHSIRDYEKELKGFKAKIFLNHEVSDYEIFSHIINASDKGLDQAFTDAAYLLEKPLSKQSNILLLEYFRVAISRNNTEICLKLIKILLRKTNQSFVIHTAFQATNSKLKAALIEAIKHNKKLKVNSKIYFYLLLWRAKKISKKDFLKEVQYSLDKLLLSYQYQLKSSNIFGGNMYDSSYSQKEHRDFLLRAMRATIFLAKIGNGGKAVVFFKKAFGLFKSANEPNYEYLFKDNNQGWGRTRNEKRFTDGICCYNNITKYLKTNFQDFFATPYNQDELEISSLLTTNALNFANEFAKYSNNPEILKIMFPIHESKKFVHKNIFGYIELIEKINKEFSDKKLINRVNKYFFNKQHFSSKIAFLGLSKEIRKQNYIDENKIKDLYSNSVIHGSLRSLYYFSDYSQRFVYSGGCNNTIAFKFIYPIADEEIRDWLEDLFIAKNLTDYSGKFYQSNFKRMAVVGFKKMFDKQTAQIFDKNIQLKLSKLRKQNIISRPLAEEISIHSACYLMKESRDSGNYKRGIKFLKSMPLFSSRKVMYRGKLRKDYIKEKGGEDYMRSRAFRKELNKFLQVFLELPQKQQKNLWSNKFGRGLAWIVYPYCNKETYKKYAKQNPYGVLRSFKNQSVVEMVRIKKEKERMSQLSDKAFRKDYKEYVSSELTEDYIADCIAVRILHFLEEGEQRFSLSEVKNKLRQDLDQNPCKKSQLSLLITLSSGGGLFGPRYKPTPTISGLLADEKDRIIKEIKNMSQAELKENFNDEELIDLIGKDESLNAFLLKQLPHKTIYKMVDGYHIFKNEAVPRALRQDLDLAGVQKALMDACKDLESTKDFHWQKAWFAKNIFEDFCNQEYFSKFEYWNKECLDIVKGSVRGIYENMASYSMKALHNISFKNEKEAESFRHCFDYLTSIEKEEYGIRNSKYSLKEIYSQLEKTAKRILMKNKIDKLTAKTFIETIDHLLRFEDDSVKKIIGKREYQKLKLLLTKCATHLIKITKMTAKQIYLQDEGLNKEVMKNYLQSMKEFNPEYESALNRIPLSKDIIQCSRKYHAPYWANSLKIFN